MTHMVENSSYRKKQFGYVGFAVVLIFGLTLSLIAAYGLRRSEQSEVSSQIARSSASDQAVISEVFKSYEESLFGLKLLFENSDDVSIAEFKSAAENIISRHEGIQTVQWVPIVKRSEKAEFEAMGHQIYGPDFKIRQKDDRSQVKDAADADRYAPIFYTIPLENNQPALGYDILTARTSLELRKMENERSPTLSEKIILVQGKSERERTGLIMSLPIYGDSISGKNLKGFVQIVFRLQDMLQNVLSKISPSPLNVVITDISDENKIPEHIYTRIRGHDPLAPLTAEEKLSFFNNYTKSDLLKIGTRLWQIQYSPQSDWLEQQFSLIPLAALVLGTIITVMGTAYLYTLQNHSIRIKQQVGEQTAALTQAQELLRQDIVIRKKTEQDLTEQKRLLDSYLAKLPGIGYRRPAALSQPALFMSQGVQHLTGYTPEDFISNKIRYFDLLHPEDKPVYENSIRECLASSSSYVVEYRLIDLNGKTHWVLDRGSIVRSGNIQDQPVIEGLAVDISDLRRAEKEKILLERKLLEGQKLESLGVLAGGIAHDFNNLLTGIIGNASLLGLHVPPSGDAHNYLKNLEQAATRAADLCQQMLAYAGKASFNFRNTDLGLVIRDTLPLLELSISKKAALKLRLPDHTLPANADPTQIRQVVMNLIINASESAAEGKGVAVLVSASLQDITRETLKQAISAKDHLPQPGKYVVLEVKDSGRGMSRETMAKIFEPFYSTKFTGRGLGLSAVLGIVASHQGAIIVESTPGFGSTFRILIPSQGEIKPLSERSESTEKASASPLDANQFTGELLLVDDEFFVREITRKILCRYGFSVIDAESSESALDLLRENPTSLKIAVVDMTMPGMNGDELIRCLRKDYPKLPAIIMSGYNQRDIAEMIKDLENTEFIQKPFRSEVLHKALIKLLPS